MDPLGDLVAGVRAHGASTLRTTLRPPWAMSIEDRAPLTVIAVVRGGMVLEIPGAATTSVPTGGVAVVTTTETYRAVDQPGRRPDVVIGPGGVCRGSGGRDLSDRWSGVRTWGNDPAGDDVLLVGSYPAASAGTALLLGALPPLVVVPQGDPAVLALLSAELDRDEPGQPTVLDRLVDLLLLTTLRTWRTDPGAGRWPGARRDPVVDRALTLLHREPAADWTVATLAAAVGCSRAWLARRFTETVGVPPMGYLARWRLGLAADLLTGTTLTLDAIARRVGYSTGFALSAAFRRERGVSPQQHRRGGAGEVVG